MFGNRKLENSKNLQLVQSVTLIATGTTILGDVNSENDVRIDGKVVGNILSKGRVVLGEYAVLDGTITATNAEIAGTINGSLLISEVTLIKSTGKVLGDLTTLKLVVEPGAVFSGNCIMSVKTLELNESPRTKQLQEAKR
jgi:cytoskeletal protein CcmA (bactofilin family)